MTATALELRPSPEAARALLDAVEGGMTAFDFDFDDLEGQTDCPNGCVCEPDAWCRHGYEAASLTLLREVG